VTEIDSNPPGDPPGEPPGEVPTMPADAADAAPVSEALSGAPVETLFGVFAAHLAQRGGVGREPTAEEVQGAAQALREILKAAEGAHGHLAVDGGRFVAHVARHAPLAPDEWALALGRVHAADLYLAFACAEQVPGALAVFEGQCGGVIDGALSGQATAAFADDAKQLVREKLFIGGDVDEPGGPRILSYAGRGPLAAWVAVSAQRTALSLRRHEVSAHARHRAAAAEEELAASVHPELAYLKRTYRTAFAECFEAALGALGNRERTLLRLHLISRLRLDQIAPMFQVNISTVSRWLAAARESLLTYTREGLSRRLHIPPGEFESLARLLQSQIDVSLARLLAERTSKA
jgi:RNA polymerase sigma-70 factor (ECF subfamily)